MTGGLGLISVRKKEMNNTKISFTKKINETLTEAEIESIKP